MSFDSFAQNGEDVVLYRALNEVINGHYIDVGAHDPEVDSVTKVFYELGWSGVNVEASKACLDRIVLGRPRDLNIHAAVAAQAGVLRLYEVPNTGMSSTDLTLADQAKQQGCSVEPVDVPAITLADICRTLPFDTTHFLKIDVEGGELGVLQGADFTTFRPWIVVVEATKPNTTERVDGLWRELIESAGYDCVLFDGLNLFFLAQEHPELRERLSAPANVLDDFIAAPLRDALARSAALHAGNIAISEKYDQAMVWAANERTALERKREHDLAIARREHDLAIAKREHDLAIAKRDAAATAERHESQLAKLRHQHAVELDLRDQERAAAIEIYDQHVVELTTQHDAIRWKAETRAVESERGRAEAEALIRALRESSSWRATRPIRGLSLFLHGQVGASVLAAALQSSLKSRCGRVASRLLEFRSPRHQEEGGGFQGEPSTAEMRAIGPGQPSISDHGLAADERGGQPHGEAPHASMERINGVQVSDSQARGESDALVQLAFRNLLRREPDEGILALYREGFAQGTTFVDVINDVLACEEFKVMSGRIESLLGSPQPSLLVQPLPSSHQPIGAGMDAALLLLQARLNEKGCRIQFGAAASDAVDTASVSRRMQNLMTTLSLMDRF